ncbi:MAG: OsmC family protein [Candidatus Helarchaeota archaeon]
MSEVIKTKVNLQLVKDMIFKCDMGEMKVKECYIDETNQEEAEMWGPNPTKLVGAAVLGCLSASLIFCLQKKNLKLENYEAEAEVVIARNEKDRLRIKEINVRVSPKSENPDVIKRLDQCKKFFEHFCTVTQSIRAGIPVNIEFNG